MAQGMRAAKHRDTGHDRDGSLEPARSFLATRTNIQLTFIFISIEARDSWFVRMREHEAEFM